MKFLSLLKGGVPLCDMTVLYRAHYLSRTLEECVLERRSCRIRFSPASQFFGRMEIKDAISYLRLVALRDDLSFLRVAERPKAQSWRTPG